MLKVFRRQSLHKQSGAAVPLWSLPVHELVEMAGQGGISQLALKNLKGKFPVLLETLFQNSKVKKSLRKTFPHQSLALLPLVWVSEHKFIYHIYTKGKKKKGFSLNLKTSPRHSLFCYRLLDKASDLTYYLPFIFHNNLQ